MWTSTLNLDPKRVVATQLLGRFWQGAYFSSFAPLQVQNLPRQSLAATNWVRIRNRLAGICGSDLHLITANGDLRVAPAALPHRYTNYPGHEVIGEVIEVGDDVQHLRVGDRVALQYGPNCLSMRLSEPCRFCAIGNYNLCEQGTLPGPYPIGGGWSEEMLLPEQQLFRIPAALNDEQAVLLEPTAVALHAILRHLPQPGERVLIIGAGTIGLLTLQILRALAPQAEISVLARHSFQIEQATRLGAAHIVYPQDSYVGIQRITHAELYRGFPGNQVLLGGYDIIFDTIGQRRTLHHALRWVRAQATVVLVGISLHLMNIDLTPIWNRELHLLGTMGHGQEFWPPESNNLRTTFEIAAELIERGLLHPEHLITHHFALTNYQHAMRAAAIKSNSRAIKVVFDYSLLPASVVPNVRASARRRRPMLTESPETPEQSVEVEIEEPPVQTAQTPSSVPTSSGTLAHNRFGSTAVEEIEPPSPYNERTLALSPDEQPVMPVAAEEPVAPIAPEASEDLVYESLDGYDATPPQFHDDEQTVVSDDEEEPYSSTSGNAGMPYQKREQQRSRNNKKNRR